MHSKSDLLKFFVAAADSKSFREAANRLNTSPQSVTRAIKDLEDEFGELLFHRNTRSLNITKFGENIYIKASNAIEALNMVFINHDNAIKENYSGKVTITTPNIIGRNLLYPAIQKIQRTHPNIIIEIRASNTFSDLVGEQIDIGIRVGKMLHDSFIAKKVNQLSFYLAASNSILTKYDVPKDINALKVMPAVQLIDPNTGKHRSWQFTNGLEIKPENIRFSTNDPEIARLAILDGIGFGQLSSLLASEDIRTNKLIKFFDELEPTPWDVYVYRPQRGPISSSVRVVFDTICEHLNSITL